MSSTGNDIVALNEGIIAKAAQPRFYAKILAAGELNLYEGVVKGELSLGEFVWMLWSVKEAVFKLRKRIKPALFFSPQKIRLHHIHPLFLGSEKSWLCTVYCNEVPIYTRTYFHASYLHSIAACDKHFSACYWGEGAVITTDYQTQSAGCRSLLADKIQFLLPDKIMSLTKSEAGIPQLVEKNMGINIPVSFSHDGHFLGYSLYLPVHCRLSKLVCAPAGHN